MPYRPSPDDEAGRDTGSQRRPTKARRAPLARGMPPAANRAHHPAPRGRTSKVSASSVTSSSRPFGLAAPVPPPRHPVRTPPRHPPRLRRPRPRPDLLAPIDQLNRSEIVPAHSRCVLRPGLSSLAMNCNCPLHPGAAARDARLAQWPLTCDGEGLPRSTDDQPHMGVSRFQPRQDAC